MEDPRKPKQLTESSIFDEFTVTGNIYVDPSYISPDETPATSPVTGEILEYGINTLSNFTVNSNCSPEINPDDGKAIFVTNLYRGTARGAGHDFIFGYNRNKFLNDIYISNSEGGDFSASPRIADNYFADSDGTLSIYIENSNFGGNLMGFGSQNKNTQSFTGNFEFTFKNSRAQWFIITFGTGYGLGETNANNNRYGTVIGNIDILVDSSTVTNNGAVLRGAILPGDGSEKAYLAAYIKDSLFQGEFGIIQNGVEGGSDQYKSNVDVDITVDGSTFTNVFLMFPNAANNTQARDGKLTITGDVHFKATNTRFSGLNMGAGLGGTGWNKTGWINGDIQFDISGSSNSSRTFVHKGFVGNSSEQRVVEGTLSNSVFGDFTGYDTRENNYIYADTTIRIVESTIGNFTLYNTINSGGNVAATADRIFGAQTLEVTGSSAGTVSGNNPGAEQSGATFDLVFHASDSVSSVGSITHWDTITVDAGADVRAYSISMNGEDSVLNIELGSSLYVQSIDSVGTINVIGDLQSGDNVVMSGLTMSELPYDTVLLVNGTELSYGLFGGQYSINDMGDLVIHTGETYLVNSNYMNGQTTAFGTKGYSTVAAAQAAIADPSETTIMVYGLDPDYPGNELYDNVSTKNFTISFISDEDNRIQFNNHDLLVGDASTVDSATLSISYTDSINSMTFGDIANQARVTVESSQIWQLDLRGATVGDAELSFNNVEFDVVQLANRAGIDGILTISNSTMNALYGGISGLYVDLTRDNYIGTVYADGNASAFDLGTSYVDKFVAGYSGGATVSVFDYEGAVNAQELFIGGEDQRNVIGTLNATITGGEVDGLHIGGYNDLITGDANVTIDGGEIGYVEFGEINGDLNLTLSGGHINNDFEVYNVAGKTNVTLSGGTAISFVDGVPTGYPLPSNGAVYYGIVYGASVSGVLSGGSSGDVLNVEGNAKVGSVRDFNALNVTGGTLNVAGGDKKSEVSWDNALIINGDITNRRAINAGTIEANNLNNFGLIGVLRNYSDDPGITLNSNLYNSGYVKTSVLSVDGNFANTGKITAVGDITVGGTFDNSGEIYFRSTFDTNGWFYQEGGLVLNNVNVTNTGFISAAHLYGVKNLTTSQMYITGGAEITGNLTILADAEVAFTNKAAADWVENGLVLGGSITMADTSSLIVSGELNTSGTKTITVNCGDLIGCNEIVRAEGGVNSWTIRLAGANAGNYSYVKDDTSILIYSTDEVFVSAAFGEDGDNSFDGHTLLYGRNAFATVAEAVAAAENGAKIHIIGDLFGEDVAVSGYDVILDGANVGGVTAKTVTVVGDSAVKSIVAANSLTIKADALLTVAESLPTNLPITIDASEGAGSRLVLDIDPNMQTIEPSQVTVICPAGKTYSARVLNGDYDHAGDLYLISQDNVYFRKDLMYGAWLPDGEYFDAATGDALFEGVNVFGDREEAESAAKTSAGTLFIVGFSTDDGLTASANVPTVFELSGGNAPFYGTDNPGAADQDTLIAGSSLYSNVYGLSYYYEDVTGDLTFVADKVNSSSRIYITGKDYGSVMNGNITATITNSTVGRTYIGAGSFGTDNDAPISIDVLIKDSSISAFHGIETETTADSYNINTEVVNEDPNARQDINADINIRIYDSVIGGTFTVLNTNNAHWNGNGATLLQTYFTSGSINVEIGGSTLTDNIRVGLSLEGGGKAPQAFNVPNTLHIVATDANTVTYASYLGEWDTIIVDATAQLQLNTLQYTTIAIGPENVDQSDSYLDGYGTLTQVMINMSGYKSGTHAVVVASNRIYTDDQLSNITVIGDNDLTGQCELAYIFSGGALKALYIFDKTDDMFVNTDYSDAINGTYDAETGQEFLFNYNAHTDFGRALYYAGDWGGTITVTGGQYYDQDFEGNSVAIRRGVRFESISMDAWANSRRGNATLTIENGARIGTIDGSRRNDFESTLNIDSDLELQEVLNFGRINVGEDVAATFLRLSGSNLSIHASSIVTADELDLTDCTVTIDVTGYVGSPHAVITAITDIVGFRPENVTIVGDNAESFGVVLVEDSLILTTSIQADTFLNSTYTAATTGTILPDGTYLEYGFNAFSDSASALAGLGGRSNTLTITGGEIAGDLVMNGANFALTGGALEGTLYATYEKDYRYMTVSVGNGSVGGIEMTAQDGAYRVSRATISLEDGAVVNGSVIGAGDTSLNVEGYVTIAEGIENVKNLVVDASGCLTVGSIDLVEGGSLLITGFAKAEGTNLHLVVDTESGYSVAPTASAGLYVLEDGNDIYVLDLSRIYYDPTYTEEIDGTKHENGDTLVWGLNAFNDRQAATDATVEGGTLYVSHRYDNFHTSNRAISLVITDSSMGVLVSGMTSGDRTTNGDVNILIENSVIGQSGNSWLLNNSTAGNPWDHHNHILGNVSVVVEGSTIGGNNNYRTNVADYFDFSGTTFEFKLVNTIVRNDIEVLGDSNLSDGQTLYWTMENVTAPGDKWWWVMDGNAGNGGEIVFTIKDSTLGTSSNDNFQLASQSNWQWGTPVSTTNFTFNVENSTVYGSISPDRIGRDELVNYTGDKVLNLTGDNKIMRTLWFREININQDSSLTGNILQMSSYNGVINIDATGYTGPSKSLIYMAQSISGVEEINVIGVDESEYTLITTENAIILFDGTVGNIYWNPNYSISDTGATTAYGDVLLVEDPDAGGVANAFTDLENAKLALTAGNKLYVSGTGYNFDGRLFGTIDSQEITDEVNLVVADGNFTYDGSIIAAADRENDKVILGNATIEIAGGYYGQAPVFDGEGEIEQAAVYTEINGTREVVGGTSGLLVTYSTNNLYANLTDFDYMTIKGDIRVCGDISTVDALFIDCSGSLTVDGNLDAESIGSIVLSSEGYEGPSKIVLHSESLTQEAINAIDITVDNPDDRWFYDGDSNLWLVSGDPSNIYVDANYTDAINGTTTSRGDLLFYGVNAFSSLEEGIVRMTSDYCLTISDGYFGGDYSLAGIGASTVYIDGGSIGSLTVGSGDDGAVSRVEFTGDNGEGFIGTLNGDGNGYRLILKQDAKVGTANDVQYLRIGLDQNTSLDEVNFVDGGGRLVLDLAGFAGSEGNVLTVAGGINNFLIPVEGETYSLATVEVTNDATHGYGFYYDPTNNSIVSVRLTGDVFIRPDANASLNGVSYEGNTLVYGYNVSRDGSGAAYASEGGTVFVDDITTPIALRTDADVNAVITHSILSDVRFGPTAGGHVREGDFTLDVIGSTFTAGNVSLAGRGTGTYESDRTNFIVGEQTDEEIIDGVWDIKFRALKDDEGNIIARSSHDNNNSNYYFKITENANIAGGTVNVLFEDYDLLGDFFLFDNVWNLSIDGEPQELGEINVTMTNVSCPYSKWMWIWEPREANSTRINLTITDSEFVGNTLSVGLFGNDTYGWDGEANVYISDVTISGGTLSGAKGGSGSDSGVEGTRTLHVLGGVNDIGLVKQFTTIDIADGAMLTGGTISLPVGTCGDAGFILRGQAGYTGEVKEYAVVGTTITGDYYNIQNSAQFLDADGNAIDGYVAVVGSTNVFIYTQDGAVYYDYDYNYTTTGVEIEDALTGKKNYLVYGDNAVSNIYDAYYAAELRDNKLIVIEGANDNTLFANGYKLVVNGGYIGTLYGSAEYDQVASADITLNAGANVNSVTVATETSGITGDALVTVTEDASLGTLNGASDCVGGTSRLVFQGDATAYSISAFDEVVIQAESEVTLSRTFDGRMLTIDTTGYTGASKRVMTVRGGVVDPDDLFINSGSFSAQWIDEGKTLVLVSDVVTDVYVNAMWTADDVNGRFVDDMLLVWNKNAFDNIEGGAAAVGMDSTLYVTGAYWTDESLQFSNAFIELSGQSFGFADLTGRDNVLTVDSRYFFAESLTGFSVLNVKADAVVVNGGIEMADHGTITIDVSDHRQLESDAVVLATGEGITGLDMNIVVTGTDANRYFGYYNEDDGDIHLLRIDNLYVDPQFGPDGENIPEGAVNPITHERLLFGANAFYSMTDALGVFQDGMGLYVNESQDSILTGDMLANLYVTNSDVPVLINGFTSGDLTYNGDVNVTIVDSIIGSGGNSTLVMKTRVDSPWDHLNTINGNVTVNVSGSILGSETENRTINGLDYARINGDNFTFNVSDSVIFSDLEVYGDSYIANSEVVSVTFRDVAAPVDRNWWVTDGNTNNAGTIVITLDNVDLGAGSMQIATQSDWNWGDRYSSNRITFNVSDSTIRGSISADCIGGEELTGYTGPKNLVVSGDNAINQILWFKNVTIDATATLTGDAIWMSTVSSNLTIDAGDFSGKSRVIVTMNDGIYNLAESDIKLVGADEKPYELVFDYNDNGARTAIAIQGDLADIYANEDYSYDYMEFGATYNDELLICGFNAFDDAADAIAAQTGAGDFYVTGNIVYESPDGQAVTIANNLINNGAFKLSASGFVDHGEIDVVVLTASSISGDGTFATDNADYKVVVNDTSVHLVKKRVDTYVNSEWVALEEGAIVDIPGSTAVIGREAFATADPAATRATPDGLVTVLGGEAMFTAPIVRTVTASDGSMVRESVVGSTESTGSLMLQDGATGANLRVAGNGVLTVEAGATVTGGLVMNDGAVVTFAEGAVLDFDISTSAAGDPALVQNYSLIQGAPAFTLTIAADNTQATGTYALASGVAAFDCTVTVLSAAGALGTLTLDETVLIDLGFYTLSLSDSVLSLSVTYDVVAPTVSDIRADITTITNTDVVVTAAFADDVALAQSLYRIGSGAWTEYVSGVTVTENAVVYFKAVDTSGNESEIAGYTVSNIDKVPPVAPQATASITKPTNTDVTVTAVFSDDSVVKQYRANGSDWTDYTDPIVFAENGAVEFRSFDEAGNVSQITGCTVGNIDKIPPAAPTASADITRITNTDVTVAAVFSDDSFRKQYSVDGQNWLDYTGALVFEENGSVLFRGIDEAGNVSEITGYTVANIDKIPPEAPLATADITKPTNTDVTVTAMFSDDSVIREYQIDDGNWIAYTEPIVFEDNGSVRFRGFDEAGNVSQITRYAVTNIDKIPPEAPTASADITWITNRDITVTAVFSDDSFLKQYSVDGGEWTDYTEPVVLTANGAVEFRGFDEAGNVSQITGYTVTNIDKIPPAAPVVTADVTEATNGSVTVSAVFSDDSVVAQYSVDGQTWQDYTAPVSFDDNGVVTFLCRDEAGNYAYTTYAVTNIDKIAPESPVAFADVTKPVNTAVSVTAMFSADSATKEYSLDGETWQDYTDAVVLDDNGSVFFRGSDAAGNVSDVTTYTVANIDKTAPIAPTASASTTAPTNQNVVVTAVFSDDTVSKEYSFDGQNWTAYTAAGVALTDNGSVMFRGFDEAGNVSDVTTYTVANIDKVAPVAPTASASTTAPTNQSVSVTAVFSDDTVTKEYSLDGETWQAYTAAVVLDDNGSVFFRGTDAAGNVSDVASYAVTNIDKIAPVAPVATADVTKPVNTSVSVSATFSADSVAQEYSLDGETWQDYTDAVTLTDNGSVFFRGADAAGNVSDVASYAVTNIDKVAPVAPVASADVTDPTNQGVVVSAVFSDDTVSKEYSLDGEIWAAYTAGVRLADNGSVFFRGTDAAGNVSDVASYTVSNIDKIAPVAPTASASTTAPTSQSVSVSATFSADSVAQEYSLDGETWQAYTAAVVLDDNGSVFFRGTDAAGNISDVTTYTVSNIDRIAPEAPSAFASTTKPVNTSVAVSAMFSGDSVTKEYSLDGETWQAYTAAVVLDDNGSVYFRGADAAGNISDVTTYTVSNIDKVAPDAPAVSADVTAPTGKPVTVSAVFSDDSVTKEYSLDGETWQAYTTPVVFQDNGVVSFRGQDEAGNSSYATYAVTNIDKTVPVKPMASADVTKPTNGDVLVTAEFSEDSVTKEYSLDGETWQAYTGAVKFTENGTAFFRGISAAGNVSAVTTCVVDNIDKVAPEKPVASADVTALTNTDVLVSAAFSADAFAKEYSLDGQTWQAYTGAVKFAENGSVFFRAADEAGNISEVASYAVANIDKVAPVKPAVSADITELTNTDVTVTAVFSDDSAKKEYSLDGQTWRAYTEAIRFTENGDISFRATDAAGNVSEIASYTVDNIDKAAPDRPVATANITAPTNTGVVVSAIFNENAVSQEYSLDGETWQAYTTPITFEENGTAYFRSTDAAGNVSDVTTYTVSNIDKVAPVAPTATASVTDPTNQSVTVSAVFSDDSVTKEYSLDALVWKPYTEAVVFAENGTAYFRGTDAAGNVSEVAVCPVANIDKIAPAAPVASADVTAVTNGNVLVSAVFSDDAVTKEYSLDGEIWTAYTEAIGFEQNGSVMFRAVDAAGNVSDVTTFAVGNIDKVAPAKPTVTASITAPTNADVTVTAVFSDDSIAQEYSLDGENWAACGANGVTFTENGSVFFRGIDAAGNVSEVASYTVDNIDKVAPVAPVAAASTTDLTNQDVLVTAVFSDDSVKQEYSLDGQTWTAYADGVVMTRNGVVFFRGTDAAGNISEIASYDVANIDRTVPAAPTVSASVTTPTNQSVTVSAVFGDDSVTQEYSLDGQNWTAYTGAIGFDENGAVFFRGINAAGSVSEVVSYTVDNIDKVAPEKPVVSATITAPTNTDVTVTAAFSADSVAQEYSLDGQNWFACGANGVTFTENGSVFFRGIDAAGNVSDVASYKVDNIDKVAPVAPVAAASTTDLTNQDVVVTAVFSADSVTKEYSLDGQTWAAYADGVVMARNGVVSFRGIDAAGNVSEVTTCTVGNIDKVAPGAVSDLRTVISDQTVALVWNSASDDYSGIREYVVNYSNSSEAFSVTTSETSFVIENAAYDTWQWNVQAVDYAGNVSTVARGKDFVVIEPVTPGPEPVVSLAKSDIDGNGISEVRFQWTGGDGQFGFWMNGTTEWVGQNKAHSSVWDILGTYDMNMDGKADLLMTGRTTIVDLSGTYIGYYSGSVDLDENWHTIGFLVNTSTEWENTVGNLTGSAGQNSIVWYSPELYALGIWKDGREDWQIVSNDFGDDWKMIGCGDFNGDGMESVLMSYNNGQYYYSVGINGRAVSMGDANWYGWNVAAIGDFTGDKCDDVVLFHQEYGIMVMLADGNLDDYQSIGQLDASDWFIVGAGDYNGDQKDDLLVRQYSTGMLGYYASGDATQWHTIGYGASMDWTVIA